MPKNKEINIDSEIELMKKFVYAIRDEIMYVISIYETWHPMVSDDELQSRFNHSLAGQSFVFIRIALQREILLTLTRLWDGVGGSISIKKIAHNLENKHFVKKLIEKTYKIENDTEESYFIKSEMSSYVESKINQVLSIMNAYIKPNGHGLKILFYLKELRNKKLAHNQVNVEEANFDSNINIDITFGELDTLFKDMLIIAEFLLSIFHRHGYNMDEARRVDATYARIFWRGATGEKKPGHPDYRSSITLESV